MTITASWKRSGGLTTNYVLEADGFYISYNPSITGFGVFNSDGRSPETALCHDGNFYILNGDFRAQYEELVPQGFDACLAFYRAHKDEHGSSWSSE